MKVLCCLLFCASMFQLKAKSMLENQYIISSDVTDATVPEGKCLITGKTTYHSEVLVGSLISTLNGHSKVFSDSLGNYSLLLDIKDTSLFFFHKNYDEIVLWNYQFKSKHHVVIDFYAGFNLMNYDVDKPVIYLYSEEQLEVSLSIDFQGKHTFSYPALENNSWHVSVGPLGITNESTDKRYPYLFWEGEMQGLNFESSGNDLVGEIVAKDQIVNYLELKLTEAGFNSKEKTDFITFWGPKMITNQFVFIQFLEDDAYASKIAELTINPKPDNTKRLYMLYSGFDDFPSDIKCVSQKLKTLDRSGFTLVDWGGTEITNSMLKL